MANMNEYGRSYNSKKSTFPRKSNFDLESYLPESMKSSTVYASTDKPGGHYRKNHFNNQCSDPANNRYGGSYGDLAYQPSSERKSRGPRNSDYEYAHGKVNDDRKHNNYRYSQAKENNAGNGISVLSNDSAKKSMSLTPVDRISSETFQTAASPAVPVRKVLSRITAALPDEKKEPEQRVTILKPNGGATGKATPVILSRSKQDLPGVSKAASGFIKPGLSSNQLGLPTSTPYKIASKPPTAPDSKVVASKVQQRQFRLLDNDFNLCDGYTAFNAFLLEQPSFLVVGVVGRQGVGKSTLATTLTQSACDTNKFAGFPACKPRHLFEGNHATTGLDAYVTSERLIVLDFPALLCTGVMDATTGKGEALRHHGHHNVPLELQVYGKALQLLALAIATCHVLIVVEDDLSQATELLRCLQVASVLCEKQRGRQSPLPPSVGAPVSTQHFPKLWGDRAAPPAAPAPAGTSRPQKQLPSVFVVHTKTTAVMPLAQLRLLEVHCGRQLASSGLDYSSGVGCAPSSSINLFTVPHHHHTQQGDLQLQSSINELRRALLGVERRTFSHATLTERSWFEHLVREWEKIRKSCLYYDYSRLFP